MGYIPVPIETDPVTLADDVFAYLEEQIPGWLPADGNLETWLTEAIAQGAGELAVLASLVPDAIFAYYGASVLGLPPYAAQQATGLTRWTSRDANVHQIDAGTLIAITPPASTDAHAFQVVESFTFPAGQTVVADVPVIALEPGLAASGITGAVQTLDEYDFIELVELQAPTSGGSDAESSAAYLDRLSDLMTLLAPRPILAPDFALMALKMVPGVGRATAIDLYNADTLETDCPRCVTVAVADAAGEPVSTQVKDDVDELLQAQREVNFLVFVVDPTYTSIDVQATVTVYPGYDPVEVAARVAAQLASYLSPASWGVPTYGDPGGTQGWLNQTSVRYLEVSSEINRVDGVNYVVSLAIGVSGGALSQADVALPGVAPLPRAGTLTVSGVAS